MGHRSGSGMTGSRNGGSFTRMGSGCPKGPQQIPQENKCTDDCSSTTTTSSSFSIMLSSFGFGGALGSLAAANNDVYTSPTSFARKDSSSLRSQGKAVELVHSGTVGGNRTGSSVVNCAEQKQYGADAVVCSEQREAYARCMQEKDGNMKACATFERAIRQCQMNTQCSAINGSGLNLGQGSSA